MHELDGCEIPFSEGIQGTCHKCKGGLNWDIALDHEYTTWVARCCGCLFKLKPTQVIVDVEENDPALQDWEVDD